MKNISAHPLLSLGDKFKELQADENSRVLSVDKHRILKHNSVLPGMRWEKGLLKCHMHAKPDKSLFYFSFRYKHLIINSLYTYWQPVNG